MTNENQTASKDMDTNNVQLEMEEPENEDLGDRNGSSAGTEERVVLRESQKEENNGRTRSYQKCRWDMEDEVTSTGVPRMCGRVFTVARLVPHILEEHSGEETPSCRWRDCDIYRVPFKDSDQLETHILGHRLNETFRCPQKSCGRLFACQRELREHGACHLREVIVEKPEYTCPHEGCKKTFKSLCKVQRHARSHRLHPCKDPGCPKVYSTAPKMMRHYRIQHLGIKEFQCSYERCGVRFTDRSHLDRHVRLLHLNEKPYRCDYPGCEEAFAYPTTYQTHRKTHGALETENDTEH